MNFDDVSSLEEAKFVAPASHLVTEEDRRRHRQAKWRLTIAEHDERAMPEWRR